MQKAALGVMLVLVVASCAGQPDEPADAEPERAPSGPLQVVDRAQDVADDLEQRNSELLEGP